MTSYRYNASCTRYIQQGYQLCSQKFPVSCYAISGLIPILAWASGALRRLLNQLDASTSTFPPPHFLSVLDQDHRYVWGNCQAASVFSGFQAFMSRLSNSMLFSLFLLPHSFMTYATSLSSNEFISSYPFFETRDLIPNIVHTWVEFQLHLILFELGPEIPPLYNCVALPWLTLSMAEPILQSGQPVEEKAMMQHHEHIDTSQHGHQEMARPGSEEGMHESEKDIPVGFSCSTCGCNNTDH